MNDEMVLHVDGIAFQRTAEDGVIRVRDTDLAVVLGYDRPRKIRELIAHMVDTTELAGIYVRPSVGRTSMPRGGEREDVVNEYWLDKIEALLVVMQSNAANAPPMRRRIAVAYDGAERQLVTACTILGGPMVALKQWFLAKNAQTFEALWPDSLISEIERLYGREWSGGRHPYHMKSMYPRLYAMIMGAPIAGAMRQTNIDPDRIRHHQYVTPEARPYLVGQLGIVEALARSSRDARDWSAKLHRQFEGAPLQLDFGAKALKARA